MPAGQTAGIAGRITRLMEKHMEKKLTELESNLLRIIRKYNRPVFIWEVVKDWPDYFGNEIYVRAKRLEQKGYLRSEWKVEFQEDHSKQPRLRRMYTVVK
jgi:hypothetical protein